MDSLEDGALVSDVSRGGQTKTTDETGAEIRENVSVQVRHNKENVGVEIGVGSHLFTVLIRLPFVR